MADEYGEQGPKAEIVREEDGAVTVKVVSAQLELPDEAFNLVPTLSQSEDGRKFLKKLAEKVASEQKEAWDSTEKYRQRRKSRFKLLTGNLDAKEFPFQDCANVHVPVMLERLLRIVHRVLAELLPDRDFVFQALPSSKVSAERAEIISLHENWQVRKDIPDFFKQIRRAAMEFFNDGYCIIHSYRDIDGRRNRHEFLNCEEFYMPYVWKTTAIDLSDVPYKGRFVRKYRHELKVLEAQGVYANLDVLFQKEKSPSWDDTQELTVRPVVDAAEGREPASSTKAPYTLVEHHSWCKLPGQEEERPVIVTMETGTRTILALVLREEDDPKDSQRFERQSQELATHAADTEAFLQADMRRQEILAQVQDPLLMPDVRAQLEAEAQALPATPPPPPSWLSEGMTGPKPARRRAIEFFTKGDCIENPEGSLGLGLGYLLEEFNKAANTAASQFTDSATLANLATGFMPANVEIDGMPPGEIMISPGQFHRIRGVSAEQIDRAIKVINFPQANPQLMDIVRLMLESADGVSSAPDVLSGEPGKANETYRGIATRVEQATKQLTVLAQNFMEALGNVAKNNARLNSVFLSDEAEIRTVVDPRTLESRDIEISRDLYRDDYEIVFTADVRFASKAQKVSEADQALSMVTSVPPELASQVFPISYVHEAVVRALKARGLHDLVKFLGPAPPVPTAPPGPPAPPPGMPPGPEQPPQGLPPGVPSSQ